MSFVVICFSFAIPTGLIGRAKGSSFWLWFLIGGALPFLGLIASFLYRNERDEPDAVCPHCGTPHKVYIQVCNRCGRDVYPLTEPEPTPSAR